MANTPEFIRRLNISIVDMNHSINDDHLTEQGALNLAVNAILSPDFKEEEWDNINQVINKISADELFFDINRTAVNNMFIHEDNFKIGKSDVPIINRIKSKVMNDIKSVYHDLNKIGKVPFIFEPDVVYRVDGFHNHLEGYSKRVYISGHNSNTPDFMVQIIILPEDFIGEILAYTPVQYEHTIPEIHPLNKHLW